MGRGSLSYLFWIWLCVDAFVFWRLLTEGGGRRGGVSCGGGAKREGGSVSMMMGFGLLWGMGGDQGKYVPVLVGICRATQ